MKRPVPVWPLAWAVTADHMWHLTLSNLPLASWARGRTLCGIDRDLSRCDTGRTPPSRNAACTACVREHQATEAA